MRDITYCTSFNCSRHDCRRHQINTPSDEALLWQSEFKCNEDGTCDSYWRKEKEE
ncbi:MAG: hypothetical protein IJX99_01060 [Clostridia bacterium]|nr:hypothetical protein [Clostridia bacterium]